MAGRNSLLFESSLEFLLNLRGKPVNRVDEILGLSSQTGSEGPVVGDSDWDPIGRGTWLEKSKFQEDLKHLPSCHEPRDNETG